MKKILTLMVSFLLIIVTVVQSQVKTSGEKALEHIKYLASDEFKGRRTGTPEYQKAAEYVEQKMREYGLRPGAGEDKYLQDVPYKNYHYFTQPIRLEMTSPGRHEFLAGRDRDYTPVRGSGNGTVKGELVFAGFGIVSERLNWNDYENLDVKGKIVLIIPDAPKSMQSEFNRKESSTENKITTAVEKGAVGIVFMNTPPVQYRNYNVYIKKGVCPDGFPVVMANKTCLDYFFYSANSSWRFLVSKIIREKKPHTTELNVTVEMEVNQVHEDLNSPNVIGIIPGTDPVLKNEYLILGAHLDHIGVGVDGFINNGADDNASGVSVVLEVARVLMENGFKPRRTLVFTTWSGEEGWGGGALYYTNNPVYPLEKTALYMNMDMVGNGDTDMYLGGMWEFSEFFDIIRSNLKDKFKEKLRFRLKYRSSDHARFKDKGVTAISLRSGGLWTNKLDDEHPEFHEPADMAKFIDIEALDTAAEFHYDIVTFLANSEENLLDPRFHINFVHKDAIVADLHTDAVMRIVNGADLSKDNKTGHIDIPKLKEGAVDLQVFACYIGPPQNEIQKNTAAKSVFNMIDGIYDLVNSNPDDLAIIRSYDDLDSEWDTGRIGVLIGIEGGYAIENELSLLRTFYRAGVRLMTLTHWTRTDWADASGDKEAKFGGLTGFGEEVVREMNDLGMIVDVSHVHDETFWDVLRISKDPVVASHSCSRALSDHFRNLSDEMLAALAKNGGMVGINYYSGFLNADNEKKISDLFEKTAKEHDLPPSRAEIHKADSAKRREFYREFNEKAALLRENLPPVNVKTVVDHIDHIVKVTGSCDHVGLGSDFDGISKPPAGLEHTGKLANITKELFERGYKEEDIRKILGGNFVRILKKVCDK